MPDINGIPYVESTDLVSAYPAASQALAQEISDQLASKQADVMTTKGDLAAYGTAVARLGVGTNGQVLTADSGETLGIKWATPAGGLTLVASETVTSASSVSINNCFTSSYDNYKIFCRADSFSSSDRLDIRLRGSGSDVTSNYAGREVIASSTGAFNAAAANTGQWRCIDTGTTTANTIFGEIQSPARAILTSAHLSGQSDNAYRSGLYTNTNATAYDGLTVYSENGNTWSGHVYVYAYQESI